MSKVINFPWPHNSVCKGQYGEWLRAIIPRGGRKGEQGENVPRKSFEQKKSLQGCEKLKKELKESEKGDKGQEQEHE